MHSVQRQRSVVTRHKIRTQEKQTQDLLTHNYASHGVQLTTLQDNPVSGIMTQPTHCEGTVFPQRANPNCERARHGIPRLG